MLWLFSPSLSGRWRKLRHAEIRREICYFEHTFFFGGAWAGSFATGFPLNKSPSSSSSSSSSLSAPNRSTLFAAGLVFAVSVSKENDSVCNNDHNNNNNNNKRWNYSFLYLWYEPNLIPNSFWLFEKKTPTWQKKCLKKLTSCPKSLIQVQKNWGRNGKSEYAQWQQLVHNIFNHWDNTTEVLLRICTLI